MAPFTGIAKKTFGWMAVATIAACASLFALTAFANATDSSDSSLGPIKDSASPANGAPLGTPFLLESGYANVNDTAPNDLSGAAGAYLSLGCTAVTDPNLPGNYPEEILNFYGTDNLPYCIAALSTTKQCPRYGFEPVVKINPVSITTAAYIPIFACVLPGYQPQAPYDDLVDSEIGTSGVYQPSTKSGYIAFFATPAASSNNGNTWVPFVSIQWEMWCYPTAQRTDSFAAENEKLPNSQECNIAKSSTLDASVLMLETGTLYDSQITASGNIQKFNTTKHCPLSWTPYVELDAPSIAGNGDVGNPSLGAHDSVGPSGICVNKINDNGTQYTVQFMANATVVTMSFTGSYIDIKDPNAAGLNNAHWTLYCYPPNFPKAQIPADSNCTPNDAPYNEP